MAGQTHRGTLRDLEEIFLQVYATTEPFRYLLDDAGVETNYIDWTGAMAIVVRRALVATRSQSRLVALCEAALKRPDITAVHDEIRRWKNDRPALRVFEPGDLCGDHQIVKIIGEGRSSIVYLAEHKLTHGLRALKVLHPKEENDLTSYTRFVHAVGEVELIKSDYIARITTAGIDNDTGAPWVAMELLDGHTLERRIEDRGPLCLEEVNWIARQTLHALGAAHRSGVIHCDLRPSNIYIARTHRTNRTEQVKLLDFGFCEWVRKDAGRKSGNHDTGDWAAPEQLRPDFKGKPSTDIWYLGLTTFKMVTGHSFNYSREISTGDTDLNIAQDEHFSKGWDYFIHNDTNVDGRIMNNSRFKQWVNRCVRIDPLERFSTAEDCLSAFEELLSADS